MEDEPMPSEIHDRPAVADLSWLVERQIVQRTSGQVHQLAVDVTEERVAVRGWTRSYYTKQLAIQGCLEALEGIGPLALDVDIEVGSDQP
jgi:hypothetical protein